MKTLTIIAVAIVAAGVGVAVGTMIADGKTREFDPPSVLIAENQHLSSEVDRLTAVLEDRGRPEHPEESTESRPVAALPPAPGRSAAPPEPEGDAAEESAPTSYFTDRYNGALKDVDWETIGTNLSQMTPLIRDIVRSIHARTPASPEAVGKLQQLNGPLLTAALKLDQEVPGVGVNGKFTDPAFMVNAMISALAAAALPLDDAQTRNLVATARRYMEEDHRRRAGYDDLTFTLRKLHEEAELKDRFFADAHALLTAEQREAISPEETDGRLRLALFSTSILYAPRTKVEHYRTEDQLAEIMLAASADILRIGEDDRDAARGVVKEWIAVMPEELKDWESNDLDIRGMVHTSRVTAWARQEHVLLTDLIVRLEILDEARRARARGVEYVLVPVKLPAGE